MLRHLAALLVALFIVPLQAQVVDERAVSDIIIGPAPGAKGQPSIASDGERFFAAWVDLRGPQPAVYGARFDENGVLLDPTGIRIAPVNFPANKRVSVVWTGEAYFVVWSDWALPNAGGRGILAARVDRDGHVLDEPRLLVEGPELSADPAAATNGSRIIVTTWEGYAVLDLTGNRIAYYSRPGGDNVFAVRRGSGFLLIEAKFGPHDVVPLDEAGNVVGNTTAFPLYTYVAGGACGPDGCLVITYGGTFTTPSVVPLDPAGFPAGVPHAIPLSGVVKIVWDGDAYLAIDHVSSVRLDKSGQPLGAPQQTSASQDNSPASIASNGRQIAIAWEADFASQGSILALVVASDSATLLSRSAPGQVAAGMASNGSNDLVVWNDDYKIWAGRLASNGQRIDGIGTRISPPDAYIYGRPPVLFDGEDYVTAWLSADGSNSTISYLRISADPTVAIQAAPTVVPEINASSFDIVANGSTTLLVWSDSTTGGASRIMAAQLDRRGSIVGPPSSIAFAPDNLRLENPSAAWNGSQWLVAWDVEKNSGGIPEFPTYVPFGVFAARVSASLAPLDAPIALTSASNAYNGFPDVASNGDEFMVTWAGPGYYEVSARHIAANGTLLDLSPTLIAAGRPMDIVWDGRRYDVAVQRTLTINGGFNPTEYNAFIVRVGISAESGGPELLAIGTSVDATIVGSLLSDRNGGFIVAYSRLDDSAGGVMRAFVARPPPLRSRAVRSH